MSFRLLSILAVLLPLSLESTAAEPFAVFQSHCVKCHGRGGKAKGKVDLLALKTTEDLQSRPNLIEDLIAVLKDR